MGYKNMESGYLRRIARERREDEYLRKIVGEKLKELGEKDLSWINGINTGGIYTGCFCKYCEHGISLRFYEEDNGISIACSIDCTPTVPLDDIDKFANMLKWVKVVFALNREGEKDDTNERKKGKI